MLNQDNLFGDSFSFVVPGTPCGKARPRAVRTKSGVRVWTPKKTRNFESTVSFYAMEAIGNVILDGPVSVDILAVLPRPKKYAFVYKKTNEPKFTKEWMLCSTKPDSDNIAKAIIDGCAPVWGDDAQVSHFSITKVFSEMKLNEKTNKWTVASPRTYVRINSLVVNGGLSPKLVSAMFSRFPVAHQTIGSSVDGDSAAER